MTTQQTFPNFADLLAYINSEWITNGNQEITGVIGNNVVNGLLTFITQSPLINDATDDIDSTMYVANQNYFSYSVLTSVQNIRAKAKHTDCDKCQRLK